MIIDIKQENVAGQLKTYFNQGAQKAVSAFEHLQQSVSSVNAFCRYEQAEIPCRVDFIRSVYAKMHKEICSELTAVHQGESLSCLTPENYESYTQNATELGRLEAVDWEALSQRLINDANSLEAEGLKESAGELIRELHLQSECSAPFLRSGGVVCTVTRYGSTYAQRQFIASLKKLFDELQTVTGESMNVVVFDQAIEALESLSVMRDSLPSRTKFGQKGQALHLVWFKDKTEVCFSPDAFNALIAFVLANSPDEMEGFEMPS
ncbi:MAG: hypothetical protein GJ680_07750 [Alteromonadaceae bacterium]|nr:hypothetical protein [Alteromonadaceae bacterium]